MDSIDLQRLSTDDPAQENKKHILVLLDRFSRRVYAEATATRQVTESIAMLTKMLRDAKAEPPLLINMDAGSRGRGIHVCRISVSVRSEKDFLSLEEARAGTRRMLSLWLTRRSGNYL